MEVIPYRVLRCGTTLPLPCAAPVTTPSTSICIKIYRVVPNILPIPTRSIYTLSNTSEDYCILHSVSSVCVSPAPHSCFLSKRSTSTEAHMFIQRDGVISILRQFAYPHSRTHNEQILICMLVVLCPPILSWFPWFP